VNVDVLVDEPAVVVDETVVVVDERAVAVEVAAASEPVESQAASTFVATSAQQQMSAWRPVTGSPCGTTCHVVVDQLVDQHPSHRYP
jgi:hypothetical protein